MDRPLVAMTVIAAYDVSEDDRRSRLAALLQSHGDRIQKSAFLLYVDPDRLADVIDRAGTIIDTDQDSFYVFRQCADCWAAVTCVGQASRPERVLHWAVM